MGLVFKLIVKRHVAHGVDEFFVDRHHPPDHDQKEKEEYDKRHHRPNLDVFDASQNIFIHGALIFGYASNFT